MAAGPPGASTRAAGGAQRGRGLPAPGLSVAELAVLRHEVGNALTCASGRAQLLMRRIPPWAADADREALGAIRDAIDRAVGLLAPVEAIPPCPDLRRIVASALSQVPAERSADVTVLWRTTEPLLGRWDGAQIAQVLANLLENAAKYSARGTPIEIEVARDGDVARVVVRDTGIGVHPDDLDAIFAGYRTILARRLARGQGIGLRLSRRLVERAGGRLWATSTPGLGSTFVAELPLRARALS
jgi:signal transduction histidine kinase